jgi:hypothetical protein
VKLCTWPASGRKEKKTVMQSINTVESFHIFRRAENGSTWGSTRKHVKKQFVKSKIIMLGVANSFEETTGTQLRQKLSISAF